MLPSLPSSLGSICAALGASLALSFGIVTAQEVNFGVSMDTAQSGGAGAATGFAVVTLDVSTGAVLVNGSYENLATNQTVAHIHGPAPIGQGAGAVLTLTGSGGTTGTLTGSGTFTPAQVSDMLAGLHYINVHTNGRPAGEIRGQVAQQFNFSCPAQGPNDPILFDNAGDTTMGPRIGDPFNTFNLALDCSNAGGASLFVIELRPVKLAVPISTAFGDVWGSGPRVFRCLGAHAQDVVTCHPGAGIVLPNDPSLVGLSYLAQGFCGDPTANGRVSNGLQQWVGI